MLWEYNIPPEQSIATLKFIFTLNENILLNLLLEKNEKEVALSALFQSNPSSFANQVQIKLDPLLVPMSMHSNESKQLKKAI